MKSKYNLVEFGTSSVPVAMAQYPSNRQLLDAIRGASRDQKKCLEEVRAEIKATAKGFCADENQAEQIKFDCFLQNNAADEMVLFAAPDADARKVFEDIDQMTGAGTPVGETTFYTRMKSLSTTLPLLTFTNIINERSVFDQRKYGPFALNRIEDLASRTEIRLTLKIVWIKSWAVSLRKEASATAVRILEPWDLDRLTA